MRSLAEHLRDTETHDRLPFHPSCPICRDARLHGSLATGAALTPRAQALLAVSVLAVSTASPATAAFAAEPDQQQEGTAPIAQSTPPDPADSPDFDPGGNATDLPAAAQPAPQAQAPQDAGTNDAPAAGAPAANPDDPVVDSGDGTDTTATEPTPTPQATPTPTTSAPEAATPTQTETTETTPPAPAVEPAPSPAPPAAVAPPVGRAPRLARHTTESTRKSHRGHTPVKQTSAAAAPPVSTPPLSVAAQPTAPPPAASVIAATSSGAAVRHGDRTHTVAAGDSLWAIAGDLLGANATPARIAREVHRLWELNRERIGTGDPNLLMIGTRLTLR